MDLDPANDISKVSSSSPLFSSIHGNGKPPYSSSGLTLGFLNQSSTNYCNLGNQEAVTRVVTDESNKTTGPWKNTKNKDSTQHHSTTKVGRSRNCVHYVTPRKYKNSKSKNNSSSPPLLPKKYTPVRAWRPRSKCSLFAHQDMKDFLQAYGGSGNDGGQHDHYPLPMQVLHGELTEHFGNMSISKKKKKKSGGSSMYYPKNTL